MSLIIQTVGVFLIALTALNLSAAVTEPRALKISDADLPKLILKNPNVLMASYDKEIATAEVLASGLDIDPMLNMNVSYKDDGYLPNVTYDKRFYHERTLAESVGVKQKAPWGTQLELSLQELHITSTSSQAISPERYQSGLVASVTQPLLKGRGKDFADIRRAKAIIKKTQYEARYQEELRQRLVEAQDIFWDLYDATERVKLQQETVRFYKEKSEELRIRFLVGKVHRVEFRAAVAKHSLKVSNLISLQAERDYQEEKLARILGALRPDHFVKIEAVVQDQASGVAAGLEPKIDSAKAAKTRDKYAETLEAKTDLLKAENALMPQIDLSVKYQSLGLHKKVAESRAQTFDHAFPGWTYVLTFSWPFGNHEARGEKGRAFAAFQKTELDYRRAIRSMDQEYDNLLRTRESLKIQFRHISDRVAKSEEIVVIKNKAFRRGQLSFMEIEDTDETHRQLLREKIRVFASLHKNDGKIRAYLAERDQ